MEMSTEQIKTITDDEYASMLPTKVESLTKIGNKKKAIQVLRNLGWDEYGFEKFKESLENERNGIGIVRIGNTYYWSR